MRWLFGFLILLLCFQQLEAKECDRARRVDGPVPYPAAWMPDEHARDLQRMPAAADVLLLGDSHAHLWPSELWGSLRAFNTGIPGDLIEHVLWRLQDKAWQRLATKNVVLFVGSNNLARGDCVFAIAEEVAAVLARIRALWPHARVFFVSIPPRGVGGSLRSADRVAINAVLERYAARKSLIYVDTDQLLDNLSGDQTHYASEAYRALTSAISPRIQ